MFLTAIAHSGRIAIPHPDQDPSNLPDLLESDLIACEAACRLDLLHPAPSFDPPAALFAATLLYRCFQFLIYRDLSAQSVESTLQQPYPAPKTPSICYSVDIALHHLPDLFALARGISPGDPFILALRTLAQSWPLSSVGIPGLSEIDNSPFIRDPSLRDLYIDRIIRRSDRSRLTDPLTRAAFQSAIGAYPDLAPQLAAAITKETFS